MVGYYQSYESFALVDGPGVRSVLFLAGCPFRCLYCHNPDTWNRDPKRTVTPEEALKKLLRYRPYWQENGGITVSGGEPLAQLEFLTEFATLAKKEGISVAVDTSGAPFRKDPDYLKAFDVLLANTDLFLLDIKAIDPEVHRKVTGKSNENVLDLFRYLDEKNYPVWVRHVLVPGLTDDDQLLEKTDAFLRSLHNVRRVEVLPYHTLGVHKYRLLGLPYRLEGVNPPSEERVRNAEKILHVSAYPDAR